MCTDDAIPGYGKRVSMNSVKNKVGFRFMREEDKDYALDGIDVAIHSHPADLDEQDNYFVAFEFQSDAWYIQEGAIEDYLYEQDEADIAQLEEYTDLLEGYTELRERYERELLSVERFERKYREIFGLPDERPIMWG